MRDILDEIENVDMYIDDIMIFTNTWKEHLETLNLLFEQLKHTNITVKPSRCVFGENFIDLIGHTMEEEFVTPNSDNFTRIQDAKRPISKKQAQSFFDLTGFFTESTFIIILSLLHH